MQGAHGIRGSAMVCLPRDPAPEVTKLPFMERPRTARISLASRCTGDRLIEGGVHGLVTGGSTGENNAQSVEERIEIARFTVSHVAGRVPGVAGIGATLTSDPVALPEAARDLKADAMPLASPPSRTVWWTRP